MKKRMIVMLASMALFIAAIGGVKFLQIRSAIAAYAAYEPPPEAVTTIEARSERWPSTLNAIGTVAAVRGVTVSADLPGIVEKITQRQPDLVILGGDYVSFHRHIPLAAELLLAVVGFRGGAADCEAYAGGTEAAGPATRSGRRTVNVEPFPAPPDAGAPDAERVVVGRGWLRRGVGRHVGRCDPLRHRQR